MGCLDNSMKCIVITFNVVLGVIGAIVIYCGVILMGLFDKLGSELKEFGVNKNEVSDGSEAVINHSATPFLGFGVFLLIIAILGVCGALYRNCCALCCYACLLVPIMLVTAAIGGTFLFIGTSPQLKDLETNVTEAVLKNYNWNDSQNNYTRYIDDQQWDGKCCGLRNSADWNLVRPNTTDPTLYPRSCCPKDANIGSCRANVDDFQEKGCFPDISKIRPTSRCIGIVIEVIAGVQVLVIILCYVLLCTKQDKHHYNSITTNEKIV